MIKLFENAYIYNPNPIGKRDILVINNVIHSIVKPGTFNSNPLIDEIYDCSGKYIIPGIIDQHVHIIGGGGENGPLSSISDMNTIDITKAGVTTVVGVLGFDDINKSLPALLNKAKALELSGITAYIYTGSYSSPVSTFTGDIKKDLVLIDKVIGVGEIAISDHRSTLSDFKELMKIASDAHIGGMISGKAGITHIHIGDGSDMLSPLIQTLEHSELPLCSVIPTHVNRNKKLFYEAINYCKKGGYIDLTAGQWDERGFSVPDAIELLLKNNIKLSRVTVSSDANGSIPEGGVGEICALFDDIRECIINKGIDMEIAISLITSNVAKFLKIYPKKGCLERGSDADFIVLDRDLNICKVISKGVIVHE